MASSDADIIQAVLGGDVERYAELVDKHQAMAFRLALSLLGHAEDAQDVSQEAFVNAYRALPRFRGGAQFSTWLYRIVVNECKDAHKWRARQPIVAAGSMAGGDQDTDGAGMFLDVPDPAAHPDDALSRRELAHQVSGSIRELPMKQRTAFVLHHIEGLTLDEVSAVMRCRVGTVKSHVFRATERLRRQLGPWLAAEGS